jgi:hypothetical protein
MSEALIKSINDLRSEIKESGERTEGKVKDMFEKAEGKLKELQEKEEKMPKRWKINQDFVKKFSKRKMQPSVNPG